MKKYKADLFYLLKYMTTYLVVIAVFITLLSHLYLQFQKQVRNSALEKSLGKLQEGITAIDSQISEMYRFASVIRTTGAVSEMARIRKPLEVDEYYVLNKAYKSLQNIQAMYEMRYSVFFKNNNFFISNQISSDNYENGYGLYAGYANISAKELKEEVFSDKMSITYIPSQQIRYMDSQDIEALTCVVKMPINPSLDYDCAVLFLMEKQELIDMTLDEAAKKNGFIYITDDDGRILLDYNYNAAPVKASGENYSIHRMNGQKYYVFSETATYGNITAVAGISQEAFDNELISVLRIIQFYIFGAILIALLVCLMFAFRQASFVQGIIDVFSVRNKNKRFLINEYGYIQKTVKEMSEENLRYAEDINNMQAAVRNCLMEKVFLYGIIESNEKHIIEKYIGKIDCFCVICICTDTDKEEQSLELFVKLKKLFENKYRTIALHNGTEEMNLLIMLNPEESTGMEDILSFAEKLTKQFNSITISVSGIGSGIENVRVCYLQTKNMLRQIFDPSERFVCFRKNYALNTNKAFDINAAERLSEFIATGQKAEIEKIFENIKKSVRIHVLEDEQEIMQLFFDIKNPLDDVYSNILKRSGDKKPPQYSSALSLSEMISSLEDFAIYLCDSISGMKKSKKDELKRRIAEYLQDNYSNPSLCAALTADEFSISEKYVFSVVKEYTGKTYNEYVESLRLEKAKEYLKKTDMPVNKIALLVGFNTIDTFYKAFKRVNGIAPGKWKENNSEQT